ncbi:HAD-IB family phosphatase [Streptomyces sp. HNM0574]|uniref:HAD family hydrolase n=1 Tax=Streptomyces sp. HNM0574 TaxID=2714954 RepID=UPI00146D7561|nr:HAD-IB family phosphatase [Streptomyces sp. HNM0574]NLU69553.1 HAD-IB family phosphatase [Streptomyces sp. HNM0574]
MTTRAPQAAGAEPRTGPRLHLFDLDGTLMRGSAALAISRRLGLEPETRELERRFSEGLLTPPEFAAEACALWAELITHAHVAEAFAEAPWLDGIREVWDEIRESGEHCAVISLSPDFFVRLLAEQAPPGRRSEGLPAADGPGRGADAARGSVWPALPFRDPVDPAGILSAAAKVKIADELCAAFGVSRADCVAYGDSMSDVALFGAVPVSVAVNADHHVSGLAAYEYRGDDLREAYRLARYEG